jgi:hypothetical protein
MSFCFGTPKWGVSKFLKLGLPQLWSPITLCVDLWLRWCMKQSYSPCQKLFNNIWHNTCTQGNQGDFWLLMVGSQIGNLIPNLSFGHNLSFKYPNGSCKPILDIYIPRAFKWYNKFFNSMGSDLWNHALKIWESIGTLIPKVGIHLGVCRFIPSHFLALLKAWNVTFGLHSWPAPSQALALVANPRLGLQQC